MTITEEPRRKTSDFASARALVVAIAASAEALPALTELLSALPSDKRLTCIIIQRASPDGREIDAEALAHSPILR